MSTHASGSRERLRVGLDTSCLPFDALAKARLLRAFAAFASILWEWGPP
jgi:hypothetical protein